MTMLTEMNAGGKPGGRRVELAYDNIMRLITDKRLAEGDRLPSEAEMATTFGISRPVVRLALMRLQEAGIIQIRWGAGSYVKSLSKAEALPAFGSVRSLQEVRHTFGLRMAIEGDAAALAAEHATTADRDAIVAAAARVEEVLAKQALGQDADIEFHLAIAAASQNPYFERMMLSVRGPIVFCANLARMLAQTHARERATRVTLEHKDIVDAILARDAERARQVMRLHVANACQRVFQGFDPSHNSVQEPDPKP